MSGLYDRVGEQWREPINMPNGGYMQLMYQGTPLYALTSKVEGHSQTLNIQTGTHERQTTFGTNDGNTIIVQATRFVSLAREHLMCVRYRVQAEQDCRIVLHTGIDGDVWDLNGPHLEDISSSQDGQILSLTAKTHEKGVAVAVSEYITDLTASEGCVDVNSGIIRKIPLDLEANKSYTCDKFVAMHTGADTDDPKKAGLELLSDAAETSFDTLLDEHISLWKQRWQQCDIQIEGDDEAQFALRFSLYHLLSITPMHSSRTSIPARGLSGQMYRGAIFWDTEIFMLPFLTHTFPGLAKNLLLYRYHTLDGARRKAQEYGFRGAFYAWESQNDGEDACTLFNVTDVFTNRPLRTYFRDKQVHISADIVYAPCGNIF